MNAYFKFILSIWFLVFVLFVVNLPIFWIFTDHHIYDDMPMAAMSLGNFGGATTQCQQLPHNLDLQVLNLKCPSGYLDPTAVSHDGERIFDFGVLGADDTNEKVCRNDAFTPVHDCYQYLKADVITDYFM